MASITGIILPASSSDNTSFTNIGQLSGGDNDSSIFESYGQSVIEPALAVASGGDVNKAADPFTMGQSFISIYTQRIYDSVLGVYVFYKLPSITYTPLSTQTSPPHSGIPNLVITRHEIINITQEIG
jgi:hypothetical protein